MSAGAVRAGGVFVEIGADPRKFFSALNKVNKSLANMGGQLVSGGGKLTAAGVGMAAPIVAAVRQGARFESTLLNIRASTGATASEIDRIKASAMQMSQALGVGPTEAAGGMLELLKAGMRLDAVLGGAGQAALQFAKVGEMDVAQAAVVMSDAMNVFGVSGTHAANTLSAAADASSTSITQMAEAFSMSSAVAGLANQSIDDLSAALAIMANSGVKGSDAGTSVKTMLMRLMAPAEDAAAALADVGLSTQSFRGADGKMLPMVQIIGSLNGAMQSLDQTAKDDIFRRIFGADAIRAASILSSVGVDGFSAMRESMATALSVADKFRMMMSGLAGAGQKVLASLERLAIAISDAVGPALSGVAPFVSGLIDSFAAFVSGNAGTVALFANIAASVLGVGAAMVSVGYALQAVAFGFGGISKAAAVFGVLLNPVVLVTAGVLGAAAAAYKFRGAITESLGPVGALVGQAAGAIGQLFAPAVNDAIAVFGDLYNIASSTFGGIYDAIVAGDLSGAMDILWAGLQAGWLRGVEALMSYVDPFTSLMQNTFTYLSATVMTIWDGMVNGMASSWDAMESSVRKGWNFLNAAFQGADQTAVNDVSIDREMRDRATRRASGTVDRTAAANAITAAREEENRKRAEGRSVATANAQERLASLTAGAASKRADIESIAGIQDALSGVTNMSDLGGIGQQIAGLIDRNSLSSAQESQAMEAYRAAQQRLAAEVSPASAAGGPGGGIVPPETESKTSIAGTFSSVSLGQSFGGGSAAERTARAAEETAKGVKELVAQGGGKVAA